MLPIDSRLPVARPPVSREDGCPLADPLFPDADALRAAVDPLPPLGADADELRGSDEPARSEGGCLRGDVGFIGWLGTRQLLESYPRGGPLWTSAPQKPGT
jgi:hypothetical protein